MTEESKFNDFTRWLRDQDKSDLTVQGYVRAIRGFAGWFADTNGEDLHPEGITPTDVRTYRQHLMVARNHKANTINHHLAAIQAYVRFAITEGKIESNPVEGIKRVSITRGAPRWMDRKEQHRLQRTLEKELISAKTENQYFLAIRNQAILMLFLNTGVRVGELCALNMEDIQLSDRKGVLLVRQGKGSKERQIPLNNAVRKALKTWIPVRLEKLTHLGIPADIEALFISQRGNRLTIRGVQKVFAHLKVEASIEALTPHITRHTFAKNLIDAGVTLEKVADLLGHESLETTRGYTLPSPLDLEKAVCSLV
jgi:site-specific recombinase XerD